MATPTFRTKLTSALRAAHDELRQLIGSDRLYGFVLYTSGQDDFSYVGVSANTEEALGGNRDLRWSVPDWKYHDFSEVFGALELPTGEGSRRDQRVYDDMIAALKTLDDEHRFGEGAAREQIVINVVCGDMSRDFFTAGLRQLNPETVVDAWLEAETPGPYLDALEASLEPERRLPALIALWRDLSLHRDAAAEARARRVTSHDLPPRIATYGAAALPHIVAVIEELAFAPTFYEQGSAEWAAHGACTLENNLAVAAAFLIPECGRPDEALVHRLQDVIRRRVELDSTETGPVSTLAENIARNLHLLFPARFPATRMSDTTNHLLNPESFLPR